VGNAHERTIEAAHEVAREWFKLARGAADLTVFADVRGRSERAVLDALLLRNRALIGFLCGGRKGGRRPGDIRPSDFLDRPWRLDDDADRRLRGRLARIDGTLARIGWDRIDDDPPPAWHPTALAWETTWGMTQFVQVVLAEDRPTGPVFAGAQREVYALLPPYEAPT
jgi:hypothetical protein